MYLITTKTKRAEKQYNDVLTTRQDIPEKLARLQQNPREELDAHKLKGKLAGKWSCSLGYDLRMIYEIDDETKEIVVVTVGSHKIYG